MTRTESNGKGGGSFIRVANGSIKRGLPWHTHLVCVVEGPPMGQNGERHRPATAGEADGREGLRVLVAGDDFDAATALALQLGWWGHEARVAFSGPILLRAVKEDPPDVIVLEAGPGGPAGSCRAAAHLRNLPGDCRPVVIAVGGGPDRLAADLHLPAPTDFGRLRELLDHLLAVAGGPLPDDLLLASPLQLPAAVTRSASRAITRSSRV
jgi:CheY-like chemotaxis protein